MMNYKHTQNPDLDVLVNNSLLARAPISNVSENGICITSHTTFTKGDLLVLNFTLPCKTEIKAYGKVKWHQKDDNGDYINGLEFWHIEEEYRDKLAGFIKNESLSMHTEAGT